MNNLLRSIPEIDKLNSKIEDRSFNAGFFSVFSPFSQCYIEKNEDIENELARIMESKFSKYSNYGLLLHQLKPDISVYWKNAGAYLYMAMDDLNKEVESSKLENSDQLNLL